MYIYELDRNSEGTDGVSQHVYLFLSALIIRPFIIIIFNVLD